MDQQALNYTRDHYNKHVKQQDSKEVPNTLMLSKRTTPPTLDHWKVIVSLQALRQRKEGPSLPLKELHNDVKRQLIYRQAAILL